MRMAFKVRKCIRMKKDNMGSVIQEDIQSLMRMCLTNNRASNYVRRKLIETQREREMNPLS